MCVFTLAGEFVTSLGEGCVREVKFKAPQALVVDESGVLYVCDKEEESVQAF